MSTPAISADAPAGSTPTLTREAFRTGLQASLDAEPFTDGMIHPAERLIAAALAADPAGAPGWIEGAYREYAASNAALAADLLRCIIARGRAALGECGVALVREAFGHPSLLIRDAALAAVEEWDDPDLRAALQPDREPEPWLADYMRRILAPAV